MLDKPRDRILLICAIAIVSFFCGELARSQPPIIVLRLRPPVIEPILEPATVSLVQCSISTSGTSGAVITGNSGSISIKGNRLEEVGDAKP